MNKIYLFLFFFLFLMSCDKTTNVECFLSDKPLASSNSPVFSGNDIILSSEGKSSPGIYEWTGPNGFTSNLANPVISNVTAAMQGDYKLKFRKGICESTESTVTVEVIVNNTGTCNQINNTGTFTDILYNVSYYTVTTGISNDQKFYLRGSRLDSKVIIAFSNNSRPATGVYSVTTNPSNSSQVSVLLKRGDYDQVSYSAKSGNVLVSYTNSGKLSAIFCDLPFYFSTNSFPDNTGTVKITEN